MLNPITIEYTTISSFVAINERLLAYSFVLSVRCKTIFQSQGGRTDSLFLLNPIVLRADSENGGCF